MTKERLSFKEAHELMQKETGDYIDISTFYRWVNSWRIQHPEMVWQPIPGGKYYINKDLFKEFLHGKKKPGEQN